MFDHVGGLRADDLHHVVRRVGGLVGLDQHVHRGPHLRHAGEVPLGNRLLQQFQPQVAALAHAAQPDRFLRRVALVGVRAQHDLRAHRRANRRQPLHVVFRNGAHLGLEPAHPLLHPFSALARHAVGGPGGHLHHREHLPAPAATDQIAHRDAERLAEQIVQRQVDPGLRTRVDCA